MSLGQNKVTDNTHEMSFHELFSQATQVTIPLFQREYVWTEKQLKRMIEEIYGNLVYNTKVQKRKLISFNMVKIQIDF